MSHIIDFLLLVAIFVMIGTIVISESKFLMSKPTCNSVSGNTVFDKLEKTTKKVLDMTKSLTKDIANKLTKDDIRPELEPVKAPKPVEHIQAYSGVVKGANEMSNVVEEALAYSDFSSVDDVESLKIDGMIKGPTPPAFAEPRVMNPSLAAAPVQFDDPTTFGTFGVTDDVSPIFTTNSKIPRTTAKMVSDARLEGFQLKGGLVKDGKVVVDECQLPSYQLKVETHHTVIPVRSLREPPANLQDIVEDGLTDGLGWAPIDENGADLTPPGTAKPASEWASINYGRPN